MLIDDLPDSEQQTTPYCYSCGEIRSEEEMSRCAKCGALICLLDGCKGLCLCGVTRRKR